MRTNRARTDNGLRARLSAGASHRVLLMRLGVAAVGLGAFGAATPAAIAACNPNPVAPNFVCSGENLSPLDVSGGADPRFVTTTSDFSVNVTHDTAAALMVRSNGGAASYIDTNASTVNNASTVLGSGGLYVGSNAGPVTIVTGGNVTGYYGVFAENAGAGATGVVLTGTVTGTEHSGVLARHSGTNLSIETATVSGGSYGVRAINDGTGGTVVVTRGVVTGRDLDGINAENAATAENITVEAHDDVSGGRDGIHVENYTNRIDHAFSTTVTAHGNVSGGRHGIYASAEVTGAWDVTVAATGADSAIRGENGDGIHVENAGTANSIVTSAGYVYGGNHGIYVENRGIYTDDIAVVANNVDANAGYGIHVRNNSTLGLFADTSVTVHGDVNGSGGVYAYNNARARNLTVVTHGDVEGRVGSGIVAENNGNGETRVEATGTVRGADIGIDAWNAGVATTDLTVEANDVIGRRRGIWATNDGVGDTTVKASGTVTGTDEEGILASNDLNAGNLTVEANDVTGGRKGIWASNDGTGDTTVKASGTVTGTDEEGILASNDLNAGNLTVEANDVTGGRRGIWASNDGTGDTEVIATGTVTGTTGDGISVSNAATAGNLTVNAAAVSGGNVGIQANNSGAGDTTLTTTGLVQGVVYGIYAANNAAAGNLAIETAAVSGDYDGVRAINNGSGDTTVTTNGVVTAGVATGAVWGENGATAGNLTIRTNADVNGGSIGIVAINDGTGDTEVIAAGTVTGTNNDGIFAENAATAGNMTIEANDVTGEGAGGGVYANNNSATGSTSVTTRGTVRAPASAGVYVVNRGAGLTVVTEGEVTGASGIRAMNYGNGATVVTASGPVTGTDFVGIFAYGDAATTGVEVTAEDVSGGDHGIDAFNAGAGATTVRTSGLVQGGTAAIQVSSVGATSIAIDGVARNASGAWDALAVKSQGINPGDGATMLTVDGEATGRVALTDAADAMIVSGLWQTNGISDFGAGADELAVVGTLQGANDAGAAETAAFANLETLTVEGRASMQDGGTGDRIETDGDVSFQAGSTLAIDIDAGSNASDRLVADGAVDIVGGEIDVQRNGPMEIGRRYTVLHSTAGLAAGSLFDGVTGDYQTAFLELEDEYDANNVYLDVVQYRDFVDAALTFNQTQTAGGLDSIVGGPLVNVVGNLADDVQARDAFDQLSGEVHATAAGMLLEDSRFVRDVASARINAAFGAQPVVEEGDGLGLSGGGVWARGYGAWGDWDADGNAGSADRSLGGLLAGADALLGDHVRLGVLAGYGRRSFDVVSRNSTGDSDDIHLGLYGGTKLGGLTLSAGVAHSWHDVSTRRAVAIGAFNDVLTADYDASTLQMFGEASYRFGSDVASVDPFVNLAYARVKTDGFVEQGGIAALASPGFTNDALFGTVGLRGQASFDMGGTTARVRGMVGWRHAFDDAPLAVNAFAGGGAFLVAGPQVARDAAVVEAGFDMLFAGGATASVSYSGAIGSNFSDHGLKAALSFDF